MEDRILGKTGIRVSRLGLGAAKHGDVHRQDQDVERWLPHALDAGVNFIDTAAMYNKSEERIGRFLTARRDEFFLATKCGVHRAGWVPGAEIVEDYSRDGILRTVEESRSKLCMDVIDLVQFHGLPPVELLNEAFETLMDLKVRGWARFVGVSADGPAGAGVEGQAEREVAELARTWPLDTWQFTYNFLSQEAATELIPLLREAGIGTIVKRPIANVLWELDEDPGNDFNHTLWERARQLPLDALAGELSVLEFAMRFVFSHGDIDLALTGTINPNHLESNIRCLEDGPLPDEMLRNAIDIFEERFGAG